MRWRLVAWLVVWGGLLLVMGASAEILTPNSNRPPLLSYPMPVETSEAGVEPLTAEEDPSNVLTRETEHGLVTGHRWSEEIAAFLDIPYGAFEKPFAAPMNPTSWTESLISTTHAKRCPQLQLLYDGPKVVGDKDCLTLSVFAPADAGKESGLPVLFHIYDGNFVNNSAAPAIYGPEYLVPKDVILVLPNYRLGPLGFLCLQNETAPGNAGLKDLALALKWTKNNIMEFGGSASKITVSGEGTAGALAQYLALSPMSREYVKGVIAESGSVLAHWAIDRDPIATATKLASAMDQDITDDMDFEEIVSKSIAIDFRPCVEIGSDSFMNETAWKILNKGELKDIVFMVGSADHAGMQEAADQDLNSMNFDFTKFLPNDLEFENEDEKKEESLKIRDIYFKGAIRSNALVSPFHTDASYLGPSIRTARLLAEGGAEVYFYEFSYVGLLNRAKNELQERIEVNGSARGDIIGYTFDKDETTVEEEDERMIEIITNLWISFAQDGKPSIMNLEWKALEEAEEGSEVWLSIDTEPQLHSSGVHVDRLHLWTELYKSNFIDRNLALDLNPSRFLMLLVSFFLFTFKII